MDSQPNETPTVYFWTVWTDKTRKCESLEEFVLHAKMLLERQVAQTIVPEPSFACLIETYFLLRTPAVKKQLSGLALKHIDTCIQEWIHEHPEQAKTLWQTQCTKTQWGNT